MRTMCDGVLGAIGRRRRTGCCVLGSARVASECGGLCMGSESRSRARWGVARAQTRAYLGAALAAAARCFLGSGIGLYRCTEARERSGCALRGPPIFAWQKANFIFVFTVLSLIKINTAVCTVIISHRGTTLILYKHTRQTHDTNDDKIARITR